MNKVLKVILIVIVILIGIIALDTLQAKVLNNSPFLKIRDNLDGGSIDYIDKGLFVNHYHCNNNENVTIWKNTKFACSIKEDNTEEFTFYLTKLEAHNDITFNDYYEANDRTIFLADNIEEFYVKDLDSEITLKTYLSTAYQTLDDGIKHITDKLDKIDVYRDGGIAIYKSKNKDITLVTCNKLNGNKDVYIGDYSLDYIDCMCE